MSELSTLRRQLALEKAKNAALERGEKFATTKAQKEANLRKELNYYKRQNNPVLRRVKPVYHQAKTIVTNFANNLDAQYGPRADAFFGNIPVGLKVGSNVIITNGMFTGRTLRVRGFVPGGITGLLNGQVVNIRHGSYVKR